MYRLRQGVKTDPARRWALPDRVFFACGACHILAHAFLEANPDSGFKPVWIKPAKGFSGNHILVVAERLAFDYHGYSNWTAMQTHIWRKAGRWWPGWNATLCDLPRDVLISETKSRQYDGLWLREPGQFLHDAMPRAVRYLQRFPSPPETGAAEG